MIHLFDILAFPKKKKYILMGLFVSYLLWVIYLTYRLSLDKEDWMNTWVFYDKLTHQMIISILPLLMGWLWIDLIHSHDRIFITIHHRYYLWDMKWCYIVLISGLYLTFFYLAYQMIPLMWLSRHIPSIDFFVPLHLWLDIMILYLLSHPLLSEKTKTLTLIFPLVYLIFQLLMQDQTSRLIYLILPLYQEKIIGYRLALSYKLWYIGLGFMMTRFFFGKIARYG